MPIYDLRPITDRTAFTGRHVTSPFQASWEATSQLLRTELRQLQARHVVLELDISESDIRVDGDMRQDRRPRTPAARLAFDSKHGPLQYATDRFSTWQANVRAIALGLEALRKVDRYGISRAGEQYRGYRALPAGLAIGASHMTSEDAQQVLLAASESTIAAEGSWQALWRRARGKAHPDKHGGDRKVWDQVEQAAKVLRLDGA